MSRLRGWREWEQPRIIGRKFHSDGTYDVLTVTDHNEAVRWERIAAETRASVSRAVEQAVESRPRVALPVAYVVSPRRRRRR